MLIGRISSGFFTISLLLLASIVSPPLWADVAALRTASAGFIIVGRERVLDGVVEAVHQATMSAQVPGRVIKINYDVDDFVEKGAILLRFRDTEQRASFDGALANFEQAESEFRRVEDLVEKKLLSQSALDKAEAHLKATRARRDQAKENLQHTRVRAPYSGIVVKRHIEVGETARIGRKLFTGISLEQLRVTVNVPEDIINIVREKKQARVLIGRVKPLSVAATSLTVSPYADPLSHSFVVRVNLPPGDFHIYPGMFTKVAFLLEQRQQLAIPRSALVMRSEVRAVYVVNKAGQLRFHQVRVGESLSMGRVAILAGLQAGDTVALDPQAAVIRLKQQSQGETE